MGSQTDNKDTTNNIPPQQRESLSVNIPNSRGYNQQESGNATSNQPYVIAGPASANEGRGL